MATTHSKANEQAFGIVDQGYFYIITCSCADVIEAGPRGSAEEAQVAASTAWNLHLRG